MDVRKYFIHYCFLFLLLSSAAMAHSTDELKRLEKAYPACIQKVTTNYIAWKDGTRTPVRGSFALFDWLATHMYKLDPNEPSISRDDVRRDRYEPFFRKMYGNSASEVKNKLVTIYWMSNVFGKKYPIRVTTVNDVDKKLRRISAALEKLPPIYYKYLENPAGGFYWRRVAGESYLSAHSFGIAIDINVSYGDYWLWDFLKLKQPISELANYQITYRNRIPLEIVNIFEKEGFFWGGRWYFYDTMHFEYRPEFFVS